MCPKIEHKFFFWLTVKQTKLNVIIKILGFSLLSVTAPCPSSHNQNRKIPEFLNPTLFLIAGDRILLLHNKEYYLSVAKKPT